MRRRPLAAAALAILSVAACQQSDDVVGGPLEMTICEGAFSSFRGESWEDAALVEATLDGCGSREEWIEQAIGHFDSPYAGDPGAAGEVLDLWCADSDDPQATACLN